MPTLAVLLSLMLQFFFNVPDEKKPPQAPAGSNAGVAEPAPPAPLERPGSVLEYPADQDLPAPFYPVLPRSAPGVAPASELSKAPSKRRWRDLGSAIALYDDFGALRNELAIGTWSQEADGIVQESEMRGGVSDDGVFAWHWQKFVLRRSGIMGKEIEEHRILVYLGAAGQILWREMDADAPPGLDPILPSGDGEAALVFTRRGAVWKAATRTFIGNETVWVSGAARLADASLTRNGRYGMILWSVPDGVLTYSFLDLRGGRKHRFPASETLLGKAAISSEGLVTAEEKTVFRFE